jgi:hypothetical protein
MKKWIAGAAILAVSMGMASGSILGNTAAPAPASPPTDLSFEYRALNFTKIIGNDNQTLGYRLGIEVIVTSEERGTGGAYIEEVLLDVPNANEDPREFMLRLAKKHHFKERLNAMAILNMAGNEDPITLPDPIQPNEF